MKNVEKNVDTHVLWTLVRLKENNALSLICFWLNTSEPLGVYPSHFLDLPMHMCIICTSYYFGTDEPWFMCQSVCYPVYSSWFSVQIYLHIWSKPFLFSFGNLYYSSNSLILQVARIVHIFLFLTSDRLGEGSGVNVSFLTSFTNMGVKCL